MFTWDQKDLNSEQEASIRESGSVFLIACPGSGKTRTLTYKIADELSKLKTTRQWVVAITYTHRAADEIHERIENLGVDTSQLWIGTIHSFCLEWILKPYAVYHDYLKNGFRVINSHDSEDILTKICSTYNKAQIKFWDCNHHYTSKGIHLQCHSDKIQYVNDIINRYHVILKNNQQIDFELILKYSYELVVTYPVISKLLSSIFPFVLVDEYQDTKEIQYLILGSILKAGGGGTNAFIVGDPNQAIYGSLGGYAIDPAEFSVLAGVQFKRMELSNNYRSSARIIEYFGNYNLYTTTIKPAAGHKDIGSIITYNKSLSRDSLEAELARLVRYSIETLKISPHEICILAPQWVHLASMTRKLIIALPEYSFDGPGMVPFSRDIDNFWYKLSKIILTQASPQMYVRRTRWAREILKALSDAGVDMTNMSTKSFLRISNSIKSNENDGLKYLSNYFEDIFQKIGVDYKAFATLTEHHTSFFESSMKRIDRLKLEGSSFLSETGSFKKVFEEKKGITISTIHGVKGAEYDVVIAYALLEGMVPNFGDPSQVESANKLLYVIGSRARKNLHLISERDRKYGQGKEYPPTKVLAACPFVYDHL